MEPLIGIGIIVLVLVGIVTFMSLRDRRNKELIEAEIRQAGGLPVEVKFQFVGYDRDNQHYNVHFADALGRKHETRCKVNVWQSGLYWEHTPAELLNDLPEEDRWNRLDANPDSSKEQIIDDLLAENQRLREQLTQTEAKGGNLKGAR